MNKISILAIILLMLLCSSCSSVNKSKMLKIKENKGGLSFVVHNNSSSEINISPITFQSNYFMLYENDRFYEFIRIIEHTREPLETTILQDSILKTNLKHKDFDIYFKMKNLPYGTYRLKWVLANIDELEFKYEYKKLPPPPKITPKIIYHNNTYYFSVSHHRLSYEDNEVYKVNKPFYKNNVLLIEDKNGKKYKYNKEDIIGDIVKCMEQDVNGNIFPCKDEQEKTILINPNNDYYWEVSLQTIFKELQLELNEKYTIRWKVDNYTSEPIIFTYK